MVTLPVEIDAADTASHVFLAGGATFFAVSLVWAGREAGRLKTVVPLLAFLGGLIASLEEAWIDTHIQLWYPEDAPAVLFTAMDHHQPLYLHLYYAGFVGLGAYVTYRGLVRHPDGRMLWPAFAGICVMDLVFEGPSTYFDVYHYYGDQPFQLYDGGWPLWVAPINAAGPLLAGYLMYRLLPILQGWRIGLVALLPPISYAGVYGVTVWPTSTLLKSDVHEAWVWLGAVVTMALATLVVVLVKATLQGPKNQPLAKESRATVRA